MTRKQSNTNNQAQTPTAERPQFGGLVLMGTVVDRTRRMVPKDNPTTIIVTYTVDDGMGRRHYVDDFAPESYYDVGASITVPVYIKTYTKRNKEAAYTINIQKEIVSERGERF